MINIIKINGIAYKLPNDKKTIKSILNHIDMCKKGLKDFTKLQDLDGNIVRLSAFELQMATYSLTLQD